jgi:hypothetical protein
MLLKATSAARWLQLWVLVLGVARREVETSAPPPQPVSLQVVVTSVQAALLAAMVDELML